MPQRHSPTHEPDRRSVLKGIAGGVLGAGLGVGSAGASAAAPANRTVKTADPARAPQPFWKLARPKPALPNSYFWTWDHSTNWVLDDPGLVTFGCYNRYTKRPETFVEDYRRLTDLAAGEVTGGMARQVLFAVGLVAAVVVTVYVTRLARKALAEAIPDNETERPTVTAGGAHA